MSYVLRQKRLFLVFHSLNRTFDLSVQGTHKQQSKEKSIFLLYFSRLFVPLILRILGTHARKNKRKRVFLLYFARLFVPLQYDNEI